MLHVFLVTLVEAFEHYDWQYTGKVAKEVFSEVVTAFGMFFSTIESDQLAANFLDDQGQVSYQSFVQWCTPPKYSIEAIMDKLHYSLSQRAVDPDSLRHSFAKMDDNRSKVISRRDFREALAQAKVTLTDPEVSHLLNELDQTGDGMVPYKVFINALLDGSKTFVFSRSPQNQLQRAAKAEDEGESEQESLRSPHQSNKIAKEPKTPEPGAFSPSVELKRSLQKLVLKGVDLRRVFEKIDSGLQGFVADEAFFQVLANNEVVFEADMERVRSILDPNDLGRIPYTRFLNECGVGTRFQQPQFEERLRFMIREQVTRHGAIGKKLTAITECYNIAVLTLSNPLAAPWTHFDRRKRGRFDLEAWKVALRDLKFKQDEKEIEALFRHINTSRSGKVSLAEFTVVRDMLRLAYFLSLDVVAF